MNDHFIKWLSILSALSIIGVLIFNGMVVAHEEEMAKIKKGYQRCLIYDPIKQETEIIRQKNCQVINIEIINTRKLDGV
jgi:hypothetical protein